MTSHPQRRPDVEITEVPDGYLARVPGTDAVTWLNRTSYLVFGLCTGHNDADLIAAAVAQAFDLTAPPRAAVRGAIGDLVAAGLVTPGVDHAQTEQAVIEVALWAPGPSVEASIITAVQALLAEARDADITATLRLDRDRSMRAARSRAASRVVREGTATHLLFLDAVPEAIAAVRQRSITRLVASTHEVIGIPVPSGQAVWDRVREATASLPDLSTLDLEHYARGYDVSFAFAPEPSLAADGFLEGRHCGSGALLVRRSGLERVAGAGVANHLRGSITQGVLTTEEGWGFFDPAIFSDGIEVDEDLAFCERVRASGGTVMVDVTGGFGVCLAVGARLQAARS